MQQPDMQEDILTSQIESSGGDNKFSGPETSGTFKANQPSKRSKSKLEQALEHA